MMNAGSNVEKEVYGVVFGYEGNELKVMIVKEENIEGASIWELPCRLAHWDQSACDAFDFILHQLNVKEKLFKSFFKPYVNFDAPGKVVYFTLIDLEQYRINFGYGKWLRRFVKLSQVPTLKKGHNIILDYTIFKLNEYLSSTKILKSDLVCIDYLKLDQIAV